MTLEAMNTLQELFLEKRGSPVRFGRYKVIQQDEIEIPPQVQIKLTFLGVRVYLDNAAVIAVPKPGYIELSDGSWTSAVSIWDELNLPRSVVHNVQSPKQILNVYNKYRIRHPDGSITEDSFTGNAGMVVTKLGKRKRLYECSAGPDDFDKRDLVFQLEWADCSQ